MNGNRVDVKFDCEIVKYFLKLLKMILFLYSVFVSELYVYSCYLEFCVKYYIL